MTQHNELDEYLETLYHLLEQHQLDMKYLEEHIPSFKREVVDQLERQSLISRDGDRLNLTKEGFRRAELITRRHRLAERLLTDVLHMSPGEVEQAACEFEHILAEEITESICTLLGHPRTCPHGHPIPEGPCCQAAAKEVHTAVVSLLEIPVGTWARIAYVASSSDERQHRLTHFGIVPGNLIKVHQLRPSVVVMVENSRLAMEEGIARDIFVWRKWEQEPVAESKRDKRPGLWQRLKGSR
jgi:DtxR family Mn-dependent transcriptional regulator